MMVILTPTLGESAFLEETVASVAALSLPVRHYLVAPCNQLEALKHRFPHCEVVEDAGVAGGLYGALNAGLAAAGTDWDLFTYINDDDLLGRNFSRQAVTHRALKDERLITYGDVNLLDERGRRLGFMSVERNPGRYAPLLEAGISPISQVGMIFSRRVVMEIGGFRPQWRLCGDQDFWLRALGAGFRFRHCPGEAGCFRLRRGQLSQNIARMRDEMEAVTREHFPARSPAAVVASARRAFRLRNLIRIARRVIRTGWWSSEQLVGGARSSRARPVLINGLGCLESGAQVVLRELMCAYPANGPRAILVMPSRNRSDAAKFPPQVRVVALSHRVFGRWLRPFFEVALWLLSKSRMVSQTVNLSHYGLCSGLRYTLYFHNQLLLEQGADVLVGRRGRPDAFKRWCLDGCLRRAERIVVQTPRVADQVRRYAERRGIVPCLIEVVEPLPFNPSSVCEMRTEAPRFFEFQFFYPASDFAHKRVSLAIRAIEAAHKADPRIGLVMTTKAGTEPAAACVAQIGPIPHSEVFMQMAAADALLFTSSHETLGLPLLEALAAGIPAVLPSLEYAHAIYGDAGVYFENAAVDAVAAAILSCVEQKEELREKVRAQAMAAWARRVPWTGHWKRFGVV